MKSQQAQNKTSKLVWFFFGTFSLNCLSLSLHIHCYLSIYLSIFIIIIQWNNIYGLSPYYTTLLFFFYFFTATTGFGPLPNAKFNWTEEARGGEEKRREEKKGSSSCHFVAVE
jgi:hypothetical protein